MISNTVFFSPGPLILLRDLNKIKQEKGYDIGGWHAPRIPYSPPFRVLYNAPLHECEVETMEFRIANIRRIYIFFPYSRIKESPELCVRREENSF